MEVITFISRPRPQAQPGLFIQDGQNETGASDPRIKTTTTPTSTSAPAKAKQDQLCVNLFETCSLDPQTKAATATRLVIQDNQNF